MPHSAEDHDEHSESRTAAVVSKPSLGHSRSGSQARREGQVSSSPHPPFASRPVHGPEVMGNIASQFLPASNSPTAPPPQPPSPSHMIPPDSTSAQSGLGNNRLATGFRKPQADIAQDADGAGGGQSSTAHASAQGMLLDDPIDISDDVEEESSDEGGMVINIDPAAEEHLDKMHLDSEDGEIHETASLAFDPASADQEPPQSSSSADQDVDMQLQDELSHAARHSMLRLADLSPDQLELQFKYALFDVDRGLVDLARPAICLGCLRPGHAQRDCPEKICLHCGAAGQHSSPLCPQVRRCSQCREPGHDAERCNADLKVTTVPCDLCGTLSHVEELCPQRFFPPVPNVHVGPLRLWVSCCICASKSHLVGDCPDADPAAAARWSLKTFAGDQITNLCLEAGTKQLEQLAANRGLRPEGVRIKGRAGLHAAGVPRGPRASDDDDEQPFLGPRVGTRGTADRGSFTFRHPQRLPDPPSTHSRHQRFDRYNPPSERGGNQGRPANDWHATDSFGRRRSRSPSPEQAQGWRRDDRRRRSRSPRGFDGDRNGRPRAVSPRPPGTNRPANGRAPGGPGARHQPPPTVTAQLPPKNGTTKPGSAHTGQPANPPLPQPNVGKPAGSKKKRGKKGKANANTGRAEKGQAADATQKISTLPAPAAHMSLAAQPAHEKTVTHFLDTINGQRAKVGQGRLRLVTVDYPVVDDDTDPGSEEPIFIDKEQTLTIVCKWWRAVLLSEPPAPVPRRHVQGTTHGRERQQACSDPVAQESTGDDTMFERAQITPCASLGKRPEGLNGRQGAQPPHEAVLEIANHTQSGIHLSHEFPMPSDNIFMVYLKQISMQRNLTGQAPVILDTNGTRPVFIDLSPPGTRRTVEAKDLETVWTWCADWIAGRRAKPHSNKEHRRAYRDYEGAVKAHPKLRRFLQARKSAAVK